MWVHLNGRLVPEEGACVSVFDRGFLYGDGIFESMRATGGVVFRQERHLQRLSRSAQAIGLDLSSVTPGLGKSVGELLVANRLRDARIRVTVSRGAGRPGEYVEASGPATVVISAAPFEGLDPSLYSAGVRVAVPRQRQIPPETLDPSIKSTSRLVSVLARREAHERGAFEAVFLDTRGHLTEGTVSNFFVVVRGRLLTSPAPAGGLPGITREAVIERAEADGIEVLEEALPVGLLREAQEAFLTNTSWEVLPVVRVDDERIGTGLPGPVTCALLDSYRQLLRRECGEPTGARMREPSP